MADPVTVGAFVVSVLTMAGEAMLKGVVGEAAKDAYKALKNQVGKWASGDVDKLELKHRLPGVNWSWPRRSMVNPNLIERASNSWPG